MCLMEKPISSSGAAIGGGGGDGDLVLIGAGTEKHVTCTVRNASHTSLTVSSKHN